MSATHASHSNRTATPVLYLALELSGNSWKLAFTVGLGQKPRLRTIPARNTAALLQEIQKAKARFDLTEDAPVVSCYEAGRDGFWLHRFLVHHGIDNRVVDSASIEVNRRQRRAKSDALDATKLVEMLIRWRNGESRVWSIIHVPTVEDEDRRQRHRELIELKAQRTEHTNRIKGLLAALGLSVVVDAKLPQRLEGLRQWDGAPLPSNLRERILREFARWQQVDEQVRALENQQRRAVRDDTEPDVELVRRLLNLKGIGPVGAWILVREVFSWRQIKNRRELAALAGLDADAVQQRGESARARDQQGGQPPGAVDPHRAGLGLVALPTGECPEPVVPASLWLGRCAGAEGGDRGVGQEVADRVVEVPGA
jgi:transposase